MYSNEAYYPLATDGDEFWLKASETSLNFVWDNSDDDIYAQLLECDVDPEKP